MIVIVDAVVVNIIIIMPPKTSHSRLKVKSFTENTAVWQVHDRCDVNPLHLPPNIREVQALDGYPHSNMRLHLHDDSRYRRSATSKLTVAMALTTAPGSRSCSLTSVTKSPSGSSIV